MSNPQYVKVDNKLYKINTDFRVAIDCNSISRDKNIGDYERALAICYKLFGDSAFSCENKPRLFELGMQYLSLGGKEKPLKTNSHDKNELDFSKIVGLIKSSFKFDYKYDPYELDYLHWYDFYNDLSNLSTSEFGNCCILNRIVSILNQDLSKIKDDKQRNSLNEAQNDLRKKYCIDQEIEITKEQEESAKAFYKSLGINI